MDSVKKSTFDKGCRYRFKKVRVLQHEGNSMFGISNKNHGGTCLMCSFASVEGFFYYGDCLCLWYVDRGSIIRVIWELPKANLINNGINFYDGDKLNHFRITSSKWIFHICSLLCNNGAFGSVLQRCANSSFSGEN